MPKEYAPTLLGIALQARDQRDAATKVLDEGQYRDDFEYGYWIGRRDQAIAILQLITGRGVYTEQDEIVNVMDRCFGRGR